MNRGRVLNGASNYVIEARKSNLSPWAALASMISIFEGCQSDHLQVRGEVTVEPAPNTNVSAPDLQSGYHQRPSSRVSPLAYHRSPPTLPVMLNLVEEWLIIGYFKIGVCVIKSGSIIVIVWSVVSVIVLIVGDVLSGSACASGFDQGNV